ncbi:MAG TPA: hypothetical protein VMB73_29355 [Acetobacteraceae bacterium]|nr:hypothetical protein [Acetobacteraceae bacterium]
MRSAILHIGTEKTGTTTLQHMLAARRTELMEFGFCFAAAPGCANHVALALFAAPENMPGDYDIPSKQEGGFDEAMFARHFSAELAALPDHAHTVIYSSEFCHSRLIEDSQVAKLAVLLRRHFASVRVLVYLRRQDELACSMYSTLLRIGDTGLELLPNVPNAGDALNNLRDLTWAHYFDYEGLLDRYARAFGKHCIEPRIFAPDRFVGGNLVSDFLAACGLPDWLGEGMPSRNRAIPAAGQHFLVRLNGYHANANPSMPPEARDVCTAILESNLRGRPRFPARVDAERFYARYRAANERVRAAWFPKQPRLFAEDFSQYPEVSARCDAEADAEALRAAFVVVSELVREKLALEHRLQHQFAMAQTPYSQAEAAHGSTAIGPRPIAAPIVPGKAGVANSLRSRLSRALGRVRTGAL